MFHVLEAYRIPHPFDPQGECVGTNEGAFRLPPLVADRWLFIIASSGMGWEHVSVHCATQDGRKQWTPTWVEMCHIKEVFWDDEDTAVQYHPPRALYVNTHPHTLHLWRCLCAEMPLPHPLMVGLPGVELK